ncbi:methyltransferase [Dactylosporangium sp. CA-092794]|uniref:methyltransferase n=1 Tax=Dactylosporangium sp. CA-092794 TaxID=3239929 RepID=UPI003D8EFB5E
MAEQRSVDAMVPGAGADLSPRLRLMLLANGQRMTAMVHVLATLKIADELAAGPRPVTELAAATGCHAPALFRILRCAAMIGVFVEVESEVFGLTPIAEGLRCDVPDSVRDAVLLDASEMFTKAYSALGHSVRTGGPAFDTVFGKTFWDHLHDNPEHEAVFDDAITAASRRIGGIYLRRYDFGSPRRIADIGGGHGDFLAALLQRLPESTGVLFDRPSVVRRAPALLAERGVTDRVELVGGSFLTDDLPAGCDLYVLKAVLHDWPDDDAATILRRVRAAIGPAPARLMILEQVVAPLNTWDPAKFLDLDMLTVMGGRERNLIEWRRLTADCGFRLTNTPVSGDWAVIECTAA